jgi:hypothetical protein
VSLAPQELLLTGAVGAQSVTLRDCDFVVVVTKWSRGYEDYSRKLTGNETSGYQHKFETSIFDYALSATSR